MKVRYISDKDYNLTKNKDYEVLNSKVINGVTYYLINNDAENNCHYSEKLFIIEEEEAVEENREPTYEKILEDVNWSSSFSDGLKYIDEEIVDLWVYSNDYYGCGNILLGKLETILYFCANYPEASETFKLNLFKAIITVYIEKVYEVEYTNLLHFSTLTYDDDYDIEEPTIKTKMLKLMDEMSTVHTRGYNKNSGNDVAIWIFVLAEPKQPDYLR